jgi:serine/threonine protein kinase
MRVGRYEIVRPIASGGMAIVELARDDTSGGLVAIKRLHAHLGDDPDFVAMLLDEARLASSIEHPNVVRVVDSGHEPLFLALDYVDGPSLMTIEQAVWKTGAAIPVDIAVRIAIDLTRGLHAAHELRDAAGKLLGLIHRDVSPHNVLVGSDGRARITDFGVAKAAERLASTRGSQVKGKLAFMAPEQVSGEELDRRADVYAAGILLWEMLAGRRLFDGESATAVLASALMGASCGPRSIRSEVPQAIDRACMKALEMSPDDRYPTTAAFAEALEQAAAEASLSVASCDALGAYVRKLGLHEPLTDHERSIGAPAEPTSTNSRARGPEPRADLDVEEDPSALETESTSVHATPLGPLTSALIVLGVATAVAALGLLVRAP